MKPLQSPLIDYQMNATIEKIGGMPLHLYSIRDMDAALDRICSEYEPKTPEEESRLLDLCPYFATIWPSARALGEFMCARRGRFSGKRVIEAGCGLGLPSVVAAKLGSQVIATDFHPDTGFWLKKNADRNGVSIRYLQWDWTSPAIPREIGSDPFDFVLASDVLYERRHPEELVAALARLAGASGTILLSDPGRSYLELALREFERLGYDRSEFLIEVEESSPVPEHRLLKKRAIRVFEFNPASAPSRAR